MGSEGAVSVLKGLPLSERQKRKKKKKKVITWVTNAATQEVRVAMDAWTRTVGPGFGSR